MLFFVQYSTRTKVLFHEEKVEKEILDSFITTDEHQIFSRISLN